MKTEIAPELVAAYKATNYWVGTAPDHFCLNVGQHSPQLARLLDQPGLNCAAYISACNPYSKPQSSEANARAHEQLREAVQSQSMVVIDGVGREKSGPWEEKSVLVLGLDRQAASHLGVRFGQNAIVWSGADAIPELVLLR